MLRRRWREGLLGSIAGGSLVTGLPLGAFVRSTGESIDSEVADLTLFVFANVFIDAPVLSEVLSWTLIFAILYLYTDYAYLKRAEAFTDDHGFRLLTATFATLVAICITLGGRWIMVGLGVLLLAIGVFSGYLYAATFDVFDPAGPSLGVLAGLGGYQTEDILEEFKAATGLYQRLVGWSFYAAPAAIFAVMCFLLGYVVHMVVIMYPLPEIAIILGICLALVAQYTTLDVSPRVRRGLFIESRMLEPLSTATSTMQGVFYTLLCIIGLGFAATIVAISPSILWTGISELIRVDVLSGIIELGWVEALSLMLFIVVILLLPLSLLIWGLYGVFYWLRILRRLPAAVYARQEDTNEVTPAVRRVPGMMLPANLLVIASVTGAVFLIEPTGATVEDTSMLVSYLPHLFVACLIIFSLIDVCVLTVYSALRGSTVQSVSHEPMIIYGALAGMFLTLVLISVLMDVMTPGEGVIIGGFLLVVLYLVTAFGIFFDEGELRIGRFDEDDIFLGVTTGMLVLFAVFIHWYDPGYSPVLPAGFLLLAGGIMFIYLLERTQR